MKVAIMHRPTLPGGGWTVQALTVEIADTCPVCGGPRGIPRAHTQHEDGEWFTVSVWQNPCGHLDTYPAVYREAVERERAA